ncbi:MAG: hypothetical protein HW421_1583 [Ignavibacteria bacterium]|nr:hypothetical protein [Ignavibacteria bacterium]
MTNIEITEWCGEYLKENRFILFPEALYDSITPEQAAILAEKYGHTKLLMLPAGEIHFFEWLLENDPVVWNDLWLGNEEEPYLVGISFLPLLVVKDGRGFPICDLTTCDNNYFSVEHMVDAESKLLLESVKERFMNKDPLSVAQLLILEISMGPIDIWHFAYKHRIQLEEAKLAITQLVEDKAIVHLTNAEHLANFINF